MPSSSVWWEPDQRNTSGLGCLTKETVTYLNGPTRQRSPTLTGMLVCQVCVFLLTCVRERDINASHKKDFNVFLCVFFCVCVTGQNQGCVAMTTGTLAGLWDVLSCSNKEKYICRQQAEGVVTTPAPPTSPPPSCAKGWSPLGARPFCYQVHHCYGHYMSSTNIQFT